MRVYGPVPSRRFGLSLGVDLVPKKSCPFDCVYCQLGPSRRQTATCETFFDLDQILADVTRAIEGENRPDVITLAGSGEPTLYRPLEQLIDGLKGISNIPILLITNGALFWHPEVARAVQKVDVLAPSLDAGDDEIYRRINRPHPDVTFDRLLEGLEAAIKGAKGEVHLEVMLVRGINDRAEHLKAIAAALGDWPVDQIDINTPVRPPGPAKGDLVCDQAVLDLALDIFGPKAKPIGKLSEKSGAATDHHRSAEALDREIREILLRRPCTAGDIAISLGVAPDQVSKSLGRLEAAGLIRARPSEAGIYYHASA